MFERNIEIIIRLHINDELAFIDDTRYNGLNQIKILKSHSQPSVNDSLSEFDALITDYSGIYIDYLILDKPIAYIPYDYEQYNKERGFLYDYFDHIAGPILNNQNDLEQFINLESDIYKNKRQSLKKLFHKHDDGKSSERLFNFITNL